MKYQCPGCAYHDVDHEMADTIEKRLVEKGLCRWDAAGKPHPTAIAYQALRALIEAGYLEESLKQ